MLLLVLRTWLCFAKLDDQIVKNISAKGRNFVRDLIFWILIAFQHCNDICDHFYRYFNSQSVSNVKKMR